MRDDDCVICGKAHPWCTAHVKSTGEPCMRRPRTGHKACRVHGGSTPAAIAAGERERARRALEADALAVLAYDGGEGVPDVLAAMEKIAAQQIAWAEQLGARVNALTSMRYSASGAGTEQIRAEVAMLERAWPNAMRTLEVLAKYRPDGAATAARNLLTSLAQKLDDLGDA